MLEVFGKIGVFIDKSNVEACHRLKSKIKPNKTIIKLSRRKDVSKILTNYKNLKDLDLTDIGLENEVYINESLCKAYRNIWSKCKSLWKNKYLHAFWVSFGGMLKVRMKEDSKPIRIGHIEDLIKLFPNYDFSVAYD